MIEKAICCATVSYCLTRVGLFWLQIFTVCHYVWMVCILSIEILRWLGDIISTKTEWL